MTAKSRTQQRKRIRVQERGHQRAVKLFNPRNLCIGFPRVHDCRLKYVQTFQFNAALGIINNYVFRLNSLYDPDYTGVGHQPLYFDQLATLYERYKVYDVDIRVTATNNSATSPIDLVVTYGQGAGSFSDINNAKEQAFAEFWTLGVSTGNKQTATFYRSVHLPSLQGVTDVAWESEASFGALCTADPFDNVFLKLVGQPHVSETADLHLQVELVFYARFKQKDGAIVGS